MSYLSFIDDVTLEKVVKFVLDKGRAAMIKAEKKFDRNVVDPFSIIFEMASFKINSSEWLKSEKSRQSQKTLSNHLGDFHQQILGAFDGWESLSSGQMVDIVNHDKKIIGEVKNKHNTLKGSDKASMYYKLENLVMQKGHMYKGYTAYYIEIIPKKPKRYNIEFVPSNASTGVICPRNRLTRQIDGDSFYSQFRGIWC
ncbi:MULTISPECIES: Eco47II family restriction endonuclease [unclassified Candidatus Tisiphia]|uniref:Eco47II family restriction endonuclease n=1 Tax=unclassified Candidatus Tisiphia TaxID=2996318 RepID=UPI003CCB2B04